ncbi:hypothetical protein CERSUDRAFT_55373 [Gelatoporia subvermispora B]|uniref:SLC41A/MgtE integral membrane domain-containing protein n=1 Tax=Ceriporiopsis subvermispora (strain B) TaxID=914234 RepID=M2R603_CERS8|nr:hypothetical protein CERSUDRAFT_55373 [Gelatoporia subvermispora B]
MERSLSFEEPVLAKSDTDSDSIEMAEMDEIMVTPNPRRQDGYSYAPYMLEHSDSEDDESGDEGGGSQALLGTGQRTRGRERSPPQKASVWAQVKSTVIETAPTLLLTTSGLLFTGEILNKVSHWKAMSRIDELIMIIPVVLNLKGNLEMNLSARLGTAANIGQLDKPSTRREIILGNLTLLQVQATVVSFVAACVAFLLGRVIPRPPGEEVEYNTIANATTSLAVRMAEPYTSSLYYARVPRPIFPAGDKSSGIAEFIMVASAAMTSTCLSSIVLGSFMCLLIIGCRRFGLDPDNIAPPVAACLGDLVTLTILGLVSSLHLMIIDTPGPLIIVIALIAAAVGWTIITRRNPHVSHLLSEGWAPLLLAMAISSGTGLVLDTFVSKYSGYALLAIVVTGLPGGIGSIFVSRLSTSLHAAALSMTSLPSADNIHPAHTQPNPRLVMITLLLVAIPIEITFLAVVYALDWLRLSIIFFVVQVLFFWLDVAFALYLAHLTTNFLWKRDLDPDMYALPFHSAFMDLVGQLLLVACYEIASALGAHVLIAQSA